MYDDLIKQLRETPSRSKRELLDKAAQVIEELERKFNALMADMSRVLKDEDWCAICAHGQTPALCETEDVSCFACPADCICKDCNGDSHWEWRGQMREAPASEDVMACQKCGEPATYSRFFGGYVCPCGYVTRKEG